MARRATRDPARDRVCGPYRYNLDSSLGKGSFAEGEKRPYAFSQPARRIRLRPAHPPSALLLLPAG